MTKHSTKSGNPRGPLITKPTRAELRLQRERSRIDGEWRRRFMPTAGTLADAIPANDLLFSRVLSQFQRQIGRRLRQCSMTETRVAALTGISRGAIATALRGWSSAITLADLCSLATITGCSLQVTLNRRRRRRSG